MDAVAGFPISILMMILLSGMLPPRLRPRHPLLLSPGSSSKGMESQMGNTKPQSLSTATAIMLMQSINHADITLTGCIVPLYKNCVIT